MGGSCCREILIRDVQLCPLDSVSVGSRCGADSNEGRAAVSDTLAGFLFLHCELFAKTIRLLTRQQLHVLPYSYGNHSTRPRILCAGKKVLKMGRQPRDPRRRILDPILSCPCRYGHMYKAPRARDLIVRSTSPRDIVASTMRLSGLLISW